MGVLALLGFAAYGSGSRSEEPSSEPDSTCDDTRTKDPTIDADEPSETVPEPSVLVMNDNFRAQPPNVSSFDVWQDFLPGPKSGNPLHVSLTIEMAYPANITVEEVRGNIRIERKNGEVITSTGLQLNSMEDTSMAGVKQFSFTIKPEIPKLMLREGELIRGVAMLRMGQDMVEIPLPETELMFTY